MLTLLEPYNQFSEHDEKTLGRLVDGVKDGWLCEIGCWTGHSTQILARRAKELNTSVIVIDNFKGNEGTPLLEYAKNNDVRIMFVENMGDLINHICLYEMNSLDAHKHIFKNDLSFLFIDAGHTYEQVKSDLINYIPKVKAGGIICGHDYESETFDEAHIEEDYVNGKHHGVIKAVNEVLGKVEHEGRMWWKIK